MKSGQINRGDSIQYAEYLEYRVNALEKRVEFLEAQIDVMKLVIIENQ